ncbi:MAG: LON peptidase substrate-binding domain-containing protein [Rhodospirillales bacterium]|nr:LON peptidase substrate-binding domain-containing protein [Rhodospirillales bacterium]
MSPKTPPLPETLAIFPLAGVLLLPTGNLPLHIFEPRYRNMITDALGSDRMIGMVQPRQPEAACPAGSVDDFEAVYHTGCAGRITDFSESEDGGFLISLNGVIRFKVAEELPLDKGYRRVRPDYSTFMSDLDIDLENDPQFGTRGGVGQDRILSALRDYFALKGIEADWSELMEWPETALIAALSMMCPFGAGEKQALLECPRPNERTDLLVTLMEMAVFGGIAGQVSEDGSNADTEAHLTRH